MTEDFVPMVAKRLLCLECSTTGLHQRVGRDQMLWACGVPECADRHNLIVGLPCDNMSGQGLIVAFRIRPGSMTVGSEQGKPSTGIDSRRLRLRGWLLSLAFALILGLQGGFPSTGSPVLWAQPQAPRAVVKEARDDLRAIIARLSADDPADRARAALQLAALGEDAAPAVPSLAALAEDTETAWLDTSPEEHLASFVTGYIHETVVTPRSASLDALAAIGAPAVPHLVDVLQNKEASVRARDFAACALARIDDSRGARALKAILLDRREEPALRCAAADGLAGNQEAIPELSTIVKDAAEVTELRECAAEALSSTASNTALETLLIRLQDRTEPESLRATIARSLAQFDDVRVKQMLVQLFCDRSEPSDLRVAAARALEKLDLSEAVPQISKVFDDRTEHLHIRTAALAAVRSTPGEAARALLTRAARAPEPDVRQVAYSVLVARGSLQEITSAMGGLDDPDVRVRKHVVVQLATVPGEAGLNAALAVTADRRQPAEVRAWAIRALALRSEKRAIDTVFAALQDEDSYIRRCALDGLMYSITDRLPDHAVSWWTKVLTDRSFETLPRRLAVEALVANRDRIEGLSERLAGVVDDPSEPVRRTIVVKLGELGDPTAVHALERVASNPDDPLAHEARQVLDQLRRTPRGGGTDEKD